MNPASPPIPALGPTPFDTCMLVLSLGVLLICLFSIPFQKRFRARRLMPWALAGMLLTLYATCAFYGSYMSALGYFDRLPQSFEWPMGRPNGVITMRDGTHVVPHPPSGRVQIYDRDWRFVRGWHVERGGDFTLEESGIDSFYVATARGSFLYLYRVSGDLLARGPDFLGVYGSADRGPRVTIRTPFWLLPFASPGLAMLIGLPGFVILAIVVHRSATGRETAPSAA